MAKAQKRVATGKKKRSKRGKASTKPARKKAAKRTTPKKARPKVRQAGRGALKSTAKKTRPPKPAAEMAPRKAPREVVEVPVVEDTIIDVIDEPVPGVLRVTKYESVRTTTPSAAPIPVRKNDN
jgi:hypothetical protein